MQHTKCLIIGSGPAGYTAAIYAGRANLAPVEYCGPQTGGQLIQTTIIENFPGYPEGVDANQMMMEIRQQAERFGADIRDGEIVKADFSQKPYRFTVDNGDEITADTVIIATGAKAKYLGLADEEKYNGMGVSACATCDGFFYRKKVTAVVGGGDTACEDALYLSHLCKKVYLVVRKNYLRASEIMQQRVREAENIEILFEHNAIGLYGENGVEGMHLVKRKGEPDESHYDVAIDGFFLAIGHKPVTQLFKEHIALDEIGFIKTIGNTQQVMKVQGSGFTVQGSGGTVQGSGFTVQGSGSKVQEPINHEPLPGVFAAGDVCNPNYRQAIVAAGTGCKAALEAEKYLQMM